MIDPRTLAYDFDEEGLGFEAPPGRPRPPQSTAGVASRAVLGLGLLTLLTSVLGSPIGGTWPGFLLSYGLIALGAAARFWFDAKDESPGIDHDGITFDGVKYRGVAGWVAGLALTGFYVVLYWFPGRLGRLVDTVDPLARLLTRGDADHWFLYGFLYTLAIVIFAVRMFMKYRHDRYQQVRTASVTFFQLGLAFLLPHLLQHAGQPEFYVTYFWPLKPDYLLPFDYVMGENGIAAATWSGVSVGRFMLLWGAMLSLVATPLLTYFFGKRWYCSWVCGCGGLAETFGDPWRQLSDKSTRAWRIERAIVYPVLVSIVLITAFLWINEASGRRLLGNDGSTLFWKTYGFVIVSLFAGVIGVGFYPLLGSRVWCRFGCPMAAMLGIFQRFFSRFRITTNGEQCMSCGNCSTFCEMGIDVRAYAQEGLNVVRAACVGCGVCAAVCPRGVLKLENGTTHRDRYPGAERPLDALLEAARGATLYGTPRTSASRHPGRTRE